MGADAKEPCGYIYHSADEELDEAVAVNRHKQSVYRQRGEVVPIALTVDLERLIESKRIGNDHNFKQGRI
jgi:hypothetical protein